MNFLRRLAQQLREQWSGMGGVVRLVFGLFLVAALAGVGYVAYKSYQPTWRLLYANLSPDEVQNISDRLDQQKVPYRVSDDRSSIYVPPDRAAALRIEYAGQGLLTQAKGYELLDEPSLGSTPFRDSVNYLRAKQAELARTVRGLEPVANARVEIARPEPSPFVREQKPTTASVFIQLKPNASLTPKQAKGIVALVSKAVEGLSPENVTVVDSKGQVHSDGSDAELGAASSQLEYRRSLETYLAGEATRVLAGILGPNRAVVRVSADTNFERLREHRETFVPESKAIRSEKTTTRKSTSAGGSGSGGVPGVRSNLPVRQPSTSGAAGGGNQSTDNEETTETQYEISRTRQEMERALGGVERLSVAATVDLTPPEGAAPGQPALTKAEVERLIRGAVGFREERGDVIQVTEAKFAVPASGAAAPPPEAPSGPSPEAIQIEQIREWVDVGIKVCLGLGILMVALAILMALIRITRPRPVLAPPPTAAERERVVDRITSVAQRDPDALARALAALMDRP